MPGLFISKQRSSLSQCVPGGGGGAAGSPAASQTSFCTGMSTLLGPETVSGLKAGLMASCEPWELGLRDCEDVIYFCNLLGSCGIGG